MDLWSILLPVGYALIGYIASRMGVKIPLPALPSSPTPQPAVPPAPVQPTPTAPENSKPILDALKEILPTLLAEVLKRLGVAPAQDAQVESMRFEATGGEGGMPVISTVINGVRFELVPRVTLVESDPPETPAE